MINIKFRSNFTLSKTEEFGSAIDSECPTNEYNSDEEEGEGHIMRPDETKRTAFKPLTGFALVRLLRMLRKLNFSSRLMLVIFIRFLRGE